MIINALYRDLYVASDTAADDVTASGYDEDNEDDIWFDTLPLTPNTNSLVSEAITDSFKSFELQRRHFGIPSGKYHNIYIYIYIYIPVILGVLIVTERVMHVLQLTDVHRGS